MTRTPALTWKDLVASVLRDLGGQAHLSEIGARIEGHPKTATNPTWRDTIRRVVRQYNVFAPVPPERSGVYRLAERDSMEPLAAELGIAEAEVDHAVAQGMLVTLGRIYGYETFVPKVDQQIRHFQGQSLGQMVTVGDCAGMFKANVRKISQIDVLWLSEDDEGLFPAYAFEVEHTTRVREGLDRLLKIPARCQALLFVVGPDEVARSLFTQLTAQTPFRDHRERFTFRLYHQLESLYNAAIVHNNLRTDFGVVARR